MTPDLGDIVLTRGDRPSGGAGLSIAEAVAAHAGETLADPRDHPRCSSPVLIGWMIAWADRLEDDDRQQLRRYVAPLATSRRTPERETTRVWLVLDWLTRTDAPIWLQALGLHADAAALESLRPVRYFPHLAEAHQAISNGARAARDTSDNIWRLVAEDAQITLQLAQPEHVGNLPRAAVDPDEPTKARRLETWALVADGTTTAIDTAQGLLDCATSAIGYPATDGVYLPDVLRTIATMITSAAAGIAWGAVRDATNQETWSWEAGVEAASIARQASITALRATGVAVQESAHDLIGRMLR